MKNILTHFVWALLRVLWCLGIVATALPVCAADVAGTITVVTEENPPYNFTRNGKLTGFSTEVVEAVFEEIRMQGNFQVMPWARAYVTAQTTENVLIYSIGRSLQREALFKWVG